MRLSVVIVNYNTKELVLECIESIKKSGFDGGLEVIVVDNASTDKSVQELIKLIKLIKHEKNQREPKSLFGHLGEARRLVKRNGKNLVD